MAVRENELTHLDRVANSGGREPHCEHCVLLIPAPADTRIYSCCRSIAELLDCQVTCERLWIEHEVPLSPGLCVPEPPLAISRILAHDSTLIARILLEAGGLQIEYLRSGGHDPFRESFFDEVHLSVSSELQCDHQQLQDVLMTLHAALDAAAVRGSPLFMELFEAALQSARPDGQTRGLNAARQ
ncbi:MAG TPA: hypothetical protein VJS42_09605 [Steroidobacteraceae bacterium]|nr:hypothetical protein [Steroidobacteraceae bacterium]